MDRFDPEWSLADERRGIPKPWKHGSFDFFGTGRPWLPSSGGMGVASTACGNWTGAETASVAIVNLAIVALIRSREVGYIGTRQSRSFARQNISNRLDRGSLGRRSQLIRFNVLS